jgi:hypothetical protein
MKQVFTDATTGDIIWSVPPSGEAAFPALHSGDLVTLKQHNYEVESISINLDGAPDVTIALAPRTS